MANISSILLKRMKYEKIVQEISNIYDEFVSKKLTIDLLNSLEVDIVMCLNSYYNDPYYDKEILDSITETFYNTIYINLKKQLDRYN